MKIQIGIFAETAWDMCRYEQGYMQILTEYVHTLCRYFWQNIHIRVLTLIHANNICKNTYTKTYEHLQYIFIVQMCSPLSPSHPVNSTFKQFQIVWVSSYPVVCPPTCYLLSKQAVRSFGGNKAVGGQYFDRFMLRTSPAKYVLTHAWAPAPPNCTLTHSPYAILLTWRVLLSRNTSQLPTSLCPTLNIPPGQRAICSCLCS